MNNKNLSMFLAGLVTGLVTFLAAKKSFSAARKFMNIPLMFEGDWYNELDDNELDEKK